MSKLREHAESLYQQLQGAADHVFLLQGGNSLKARAELRERMAVVGRNESVIVVATGQYIGEGFNYPRLDTMLLAMPISFEGNVEQYAGRLNRDYDGKKDVIIYDYIDQNIPKLERMYHKRLRTYAPENDARFQALHAGRRHASGGGYLSGYEQLRSSRVT